jgi:AcrR family transcriptional regulator
MSATTTMSTTTTAAMIADTFTQRGRGGGLPSVGSAMSSSSSIGQRAELSIKFTRQSVCVKSLCANSDAAYTYVVPKLWNETIETHRREVREAILDTTIGLVEEHGLLSVTMTQIAEKTGIGRATLYKYFPDVGAILHAWHERGIKAHLGQLAEIRDRPGAPGERLAAVFHAYALIARDSHGHSDTELAAFLHRDHDHQVIRAERQLRDLIMGLLSEAVEAGDVREDVAPEELASYCLHALAAARTLRSKTEVQRLVEVTLAGLRPDN